MSRANLYEIESLNQRGGRMLSVVDLIEAGTLDAAVAGYLLARVAEGASFLCAAGPGGVGKTTLLACLLSFLPPDELIRTVTNPRRIDPPVEPTCFLCHEIGPGHWYGYLWGADAARFLALRRHGRIAGSLHADTPEEVAGQLLGPGVGAAEADLAAIDLLAFMVRTGGRRRVSAVYESVGGGRARWEPTVIWDPAEDAFTVRPMRSVPRASEATRFVAGLKARGVRTLEEVLEAVAEFHAL